MTITALVPEWSANEELSNFAAERRGLEPYLGVFHGYSIQYSDTQGCDVIQLNNRAETMPGRLDDVPMRRIIVVKPDSPLTKAIDGRYEDGPITARVETFIKDGVLQQSLRAEGTDGVTVEELNLWFDNLLAGNRAGKCVSAIAYPDQPGTSLLAQQ